MHNLRHKVHKTPLNTKWRPASTHTNTCLSLLEGSEPLLEPGGQHKVTATCQLSQLLPQVWVLTQRQLPHPHPRSTRDGELIYTGRAARSRCILFGPSLNSVCEEEEEEEEEGQQWKSSVIVLCQSRSLLMQASSCYCDSVSHSRSAHSLSSNPAALSLRNMHTHTIRTRTHRQALRGGQGALATKLPGR